jgi:hypothetical protein
MVASQQGQRASDPGSSTSTSPHPIDTGDEVRDTDGAWVQSARVDRGCQSEREEGDLVSWTGLFVFVCVERAGGGKYTQILVTAR